MSKKSKPQAITAFESQPLQVFVEKSYLDYSMYVILDRALPHLSDGLKPVQRRILYGMSELGLSITAKYKKSVRTVGDVLGKFHPHSDAACYEAMVLMAQNFSYRYPLIDGQGNFGSVDDPKSFAAMRYTEARMSAFSNVYLGELAYGTVDWQPNFDGTLQEPKTLPAQLPTVLLNGSSGIAVGMATDIPPHHLNEIVDACVFILKNPKATLDDICHIVKGPDYPTGAEINNTPEEIKEIYRTGNGSIRSCARYQIVNNEIVITTLPYQVSPARIIEQIAQQMQAKKLPSVEDIRDESDQNEPIRIVIVPKSNRVELQPLISHLFATTDLQKSHRVNLNMIGLDGKPRVKGLLEILNEWLIYRFDVVTRRLQDRFAKVNERLEILAGLLVAYLNIDEVIAIIRKADKPKEALIEKFKITVLQAESILELKLRQLAKLEEIKIKGEQQALEEERKSLEALLGSKSKLTQFIIKELESLKKQFGDARRSPCIVREQAQALSEEARLPTENVTIILSEKGWVRAAKGHDMDPLSLSYKAGDGFLSAAQGKSNQPALFFDSTGRVYSLMPHILPSARSLGEPLTTRLSPPAGATFVSVIMPLEDESHLIMQSSEGYGFITSVADLASKNKTGKHLLKADQGVVPPVKIKNLKKDYLAIFTAQGKLLIIKATELPELAKGRGNKLIQLDKNGDHVIGMLALSPQQKLLLISGQKEKRLSPSEWASFVKDRGLKGNALPKGFDKKVSFKSE